MPAPTTYLDWMRLVVDMEKQQIQLPQLPGEPGWYAVWREYDLRGRGYLLNDKYAQAEDTRKKAATDVRTRTLGGLLRFDHLLLQLLAAPGDPRRSVLTSRLVLHDRRGKRVSLVEPVTFGRYTWERRAPVRTIGDVAELYFIGADLSWVSKDPDQTNARSQNRADAFYIDPNIDVAAASQALDPVAAFDAARQAALDALTDPDNVPSTDGYVAPNEDMPMMLKSVAREAARLRDLLARRRP